MYRDNASIETRYGWVIIGVSLIISTIAQAAPNLLFVNMKSIAGTFDWPRAVPSMAVSLLMFGTGVGGIAMGWWMDRRGVMSPVLFGSVMIGVGAFLMANAHGQAGVYLACGLFMGFLGESAMIAPLVANATRWFDRNRGLAVAIIASGQGVAGAVWPPIIRVLSEDYGWRTAYTYFGWFALITLVPLSLLLRPKPPINPSKLATNTKDHGRARGLGLSVGLVQSLLCLAAVGCCTAMAMPIAHLISHTTDLGFTSAHAARLYSFLFAAAFISRILFGVLADRIGAARTQLIASACQALMLIAFAFVTSLPGLYIAALLFGIGFAGIMPCYALLIREWFRDSEVGWRVAVLYLFASIGMALGGWLGGYVFDNSGGYAIAFLMGFGFNVMNLVVLGGLFWRRCRLESSLQPV